MHSGSKSLLFPTSLDNAWPYPSLSAFLDKSTRILDSSIQLAQLTGIPQDDRLTSIWSTMYEFCSVINLAAVSQRRITMEVFLNSMASTMYRLIHMRFAPCSVSEAIRLGLLCFCSSVFLQWQQLGMTYPHLASSVRDSFLKLSERELPISGQLSFWILIVASVSVLTTSDEDWLQPLLRQAAGTIGIQSWDQARKVLSPIMWIDSVHDKAGKMMFDAALLHGQE